jgi:prepilin-type processing-associated H-X9-DG protein
MVYLFSLLGGEGNILYADGRCQTALYNFDMKFVQSIPSPNSCKSPNVISVSITQDPMNERESLYVLDMSPTVEIDRCFEVFCHRKKRWRWDLLPSPPFFSDPETAPDLYSDAVVNRSIIYV